MPRRSLIAAITLTTLIVAGLLLQTPLLRHVRSAAWTVWLSAVARVFTIGPFNVSHDVDTQLQELLAENVRLKWEQREFLLLKEQLGNPAYASFRNIPAIVAARPLDTFHSQFTINRGAKDGVTLDAPVVVYGSTLVGFVTELHEHAATVQLLLHPATNLAAQVASDKRPKGLVAGRHFTSLALTTVPRDATLTPGQDVVTVGKEGLPEGLLIGKISFVQSAEDAAYHEAVVSLLFDPDSLRAVNVLVLP